MLNKHWGVFQVKLKPPRSAVLYDSYPGYIDAFFLQHAAGVLLDILMWAYAAARRPPMASPELFRDSFSCVDLQGVCPRQTEAECGVLACLNTFSLHAGRPFQQLTGASARLSLLTDLVALSRKRALSRPEWH